MDNLDLLPYGTQTVGEDILTSLKRSLQGWFLHGQIEGWSPATIKDRRMWAARFVEHLERRGLPFNADGIRSWLVALKEGTEHRCRKKLGPGSIDHVHRLLRAFCQWLVEEEEESDNLMRRIPPPINRDHKARPFEEHEVGALLDAARNTRNARRDVALLTTLLDSGIRVGELCALKFGDVDLNGGKLHIRNGKGGKSRTAPISKPTLKALWEYLKSEHRSSNDYLFETQRGAPIERNTVRHLLNRLGEETGVHAHPHRFRHTAAVFMLRQGVSAFHVMQFLGHSTLAATQRYARLADNDVLEVHRSASPLNLVTRRSRKG